MNKNIIAGVATLAIALLGGCNNAKSPDSVAKDVESAQQKASTEVANTEKDAAKDVGSAAEKVDSKLTDLNNTAAKDAYKITLAQADGDHKVALAKCDALSGDAQKNCKQQADADYDAVKANAKATAVAEKQ